MIKGGSLIKDDKLVKTASYCLAYISLGLVISSLGPTLLGLAENTGSQFREISYLFIARNSGHMLFSLLGGRLYDRLSGHLVMAGALFMLVITMTLVPLIPQLLLLIAVVFILGIANGVIDVGANALLVWVHGARVGPFMNALHFTFGVGAFIGPIIIAQVMSRTDGEITWAYWTLALLMAPSAFWLLSLPSPAIQTGAEDTRPGGSTMDCYSSLLFSFFFMEGQRLVLGAGFPATWSL